MSTKSKDVYVMIDGVNFGAENPKFPNGARVLDLYAKSGSKSGELVFQVKGGAYGDLWAGASTGKVFPRAVIVTVESGGDPDGGEAKIRTQTMFEVAVLRYEFRGDSTFTLSFTRASADFAWVPLIFTKIRFEDQMPDLLKKSRLR